MSQLETWSQMDEVRMLLERVERFVWVGFALLLVRYTIVVLREPQFWFLFVYIIAWAVCSQVMLKVSSRDDTPYRFYAALGLISLGASMFLIWPVAWPPILPSLFCVVLTSLLLRFTRAIVATLMVTVLSIAVLAIVETTAPFQAAKWTFTVPVVAPCLFGAGLRMSWLATIRAEKMTVRLEQLNDALQLSLRASDELVAARERTRMARELHDSIGHAFTIGSIQLDAAQRLLERGEHEKVDDALGIVQTSMQNGLKELRSCVTVLRDDTPEHSLTQQLSTLIDGATHERLSISLTIMGTERRLLTSHEFACFRVLQESLTNIAKHADATEVEVSLTYLDSAVELVIQDNGVGTSSVRPGYGIQGLIERLHVLGGTLDMQSDVSEGFTMQMKLPLHTH